MKLQEACITCTKRISLQPLPLTTLVSHLLKEAKLALNIQSETNKQTKKKTYTHLPALISFVVIRGNVKEAKIHNNLFQYYFLLILIFILSFACLTRVCYLFMCLYAGHVCVYIYGFVFERKTHCWSQILCDVELFLHL